MNTLNKLLLVTLSTSVVLIAQPNKQNKQLQQINKEGKNASSKLLKTLGKNMKKNMKAGGPMKALDFCSNEAYALTEKVNTTLPKNVSVKRISTNYRSPANKPSTDELKVLKTFEDMKENNIVLPNKLVQKVDEHTYKFYKPLTIQKQVCLKCHGDIKDVELRREIEKRYPLDKATGYKMGDLRGAVVVTIKK